ncbi:DUF488 domain-containing protein [Solidesulfovibrio alcoholivorans]|uniref:DUF488 domain-containing protein n=1 Tax=Solidesulfovibrio alcoholivorans TaxID=81406 RepID=UPI000A02B016|nr:DUF488 domain-containing protein [Solidesulfovibrio alcoholivorans]
MIKIKRVYVEKVQDDGKRYLVDRVWPRGISKERAGIDGWLKELAPSTALRTWFSHDPEKWEEFKEKYRDELSNPLLSDILLQLREEASRSVVTLIYSAKDTKLNNAVCLKEILELG